MKRFSVVPIMLILPAAFSTQAAPNPSTAKAPAFRRILANARYVYVASYDGDQFDSNLLPEDRAAIGAAQEAIQNWGKLIKSALCVMMCWKMGANLICSAATWLQTEFPDLQIWERRLHIPAESDHVSRVISIAILI